MRYNTRYKVGDEDRYLQAIEKLNTIQLKELLQSRREGALNASKRLAAIFSAAASSGFLRDCSINNSAISDDDSTFELTEEGSPYETDDNSSMDEEEDLDLDDGDDDDDDDDYDGTPWEYGDESTTNDDEDIEDADTINDSDEDTAYSLVEDDIRALVEDFHDLMREILEHNSVLCLMQFALNKRVGKENDGPSLVHAMLPWAFDAEDRDDADSLLELDSLSVEY